MATDQYSDDTEEWRPAPGWIYFEVSSHGRVRSLHLGRKHRIRKQSRSQSGYMRVTFTENGRKQCVRVHRLVCEAFHGPPPAQRQEVAHSDGTRDNNHYTNLRWASHKENFADQVAHGTFSKPPSPKGSGRLSEADLANIAALKAAGNRSVVIASLYGVHRRTVTRIYRTGSP